MKFQHVSEVLHFFDQFSVTTIDLTLARMEQALAMLGNPHEQYRTIHIGGTNGKGSTTSFLRTALQAHGYRVATFTSPHIETFHERLQLNGDPITDAELLATTNHVFAVLGSAVTTLGLTQFELMTLVMFCYFAKQQPDFALIEVGMGGRFDATNVITPLISLVTNVSLDHQAFLGDCVEVIAAEKAGIIKAHVPIMTTAKAAPVLAVLRAEAMQQTAPFYQLGEQFHVSEVELSETATTFTYADEQTGPLPITLTLKGRHQVDNASLALCALSYLAQEGMIVLERERLQAAFQATQWLGRMELLQEQPVTYVDGAHNEAGIISLVESIRTYFPNRCHVLFCAMKDKDVATMLPQLEAVAKTVTLTSFAFPRAARAQQLLPFAQAATTTAIEDYREAYAAVCAKAADNDVIVITGSLYFVAAVRADLKKQ